MLEGLPWIVPPADVITTCAPLPPKFKALKIGFIKRLKVDNARVLVAPAAPVTFNTPNPTVTLDANVRVELAPVDPI